MEDIEKVKEPEPKAVGGEIVSSSHSDGPVDQKYPENGEPPLPSNVSSCHGHYSNVYLSDSYSRIVFKRELTTFAANGQLPI